MALPAVPPLGSLRTRLLRHATDLHVAVMRLSGGRIGGQVGKAPMLSVHHVGRKSGQKRVTPLLYQPDGDGWVIVASRGGSDQHPAWLLNLREMTETTIEIGPQRILVSIREVTDEAERGRLWSKVVAVWPDYETYQSRTERLIPLIMLEPVAGSAGAA